MSQIAITYNLETAKIITVPVGQTISGDWTKFVTVAVVPQNKTDLVIGILLGLLSRTDDIVFISNKINELLSKYDKNVTHLKNTDL